MTDRGFFLPLSFACTLGAVAMTAVSVAGEQWCLVAHGLMVTGMGVWCVRLWMPPLHTPESVLREIAEGLENGTVTLGDDNDEDV